MAILQSSIIESGVSISSIVKVLPLLNIDPRLAPADTKMKVLSFVWVAILTTLLCNYIWVATICF